MFLTCLPISSKKQSAATTQPPLPHSAMSKDTTTATAPYPPAAVYVAQLVAEELVPPTSGDRFRHEAAVQFVLDTLADAYFDIHDAIHLAVTASPDALPGHEGYVEKADLIRAARLAWGMGRDVVATSPGAWHLENPNKGEER